MAARADFTRVARASGVLWACTLALDRLAPVGVLRLWRPRLVAAALLAEQVEAILAAWGTPADQRATIVERMLYADLRGIDSHGCCMLPFYQRLRADGRLNPAPHIRVVTESATTALVDGGGGLGHVPATTAMALAIDKCRVAGVGAVAVRNSGHFGAAGAYAAMATAAGLLGVATTSTPTPAVVPTFGRDAMLGTNPIALAAPAVANPPFLLDMATSAASLGKMVERWRAGRRVPRGWAFDERGRAITNGRRAAEARRLAPLGSDPDHGSHKGYGLAVAVEILSALLPGIGATTAVDGRRSEVGHFLLAIDPARFRPDGGFAADVDHLIDALRATPPLDAATPVQVAGDPEQTILRERSTHGIPLARTVIEDIRGVAAASGAPFLLDAAPLATARR